MTDLRHDIEFRYYYNTHLLHKSGVHFDELDKDIRDFAGYLFYNAVNILQHQKISETLKQFPSGGISSNSKDDPTTQERIIPMNRLKIPDRPTGVPAHRPDFTS